MIIYIIARQTFVSYKMLEEWESLNMNLRKTGAISKVKQEVKKAYKITKSKRTLETRIKILDYFDDFFEYGNFTKDMNENHKSILSHPLGIGGWADYARIKNNSGGLYRPESHYYDQTYNRDGTPIRVLNRDHNTDSKRKAHMLALLIHIVGDMHQPLHMVTRCKSQGMKCDEGRLKFPISGLKNIHSLHELWDNAMFMFVEQKRGDSAVKYYSQPANDIIKNTQGILFQTTRCLTLLNRMPLTCSQKEKKRSMISLKKIQRLTNFCTKLEELQG
eukprot:TRINITY_DN2432_c0_g2_i8.p1 TRINITY_DN2432_c0_g2~~TRINITY_DN2432_c0_g2_i8.p1  ORF type:complete len:275 (+),score=-15.32 TRINITY_DN2432_c0_g2_i8:253-1077(+)